MILPLQVSPAPSILDVSSVAFLVLAVIALVLASVAQSVEQATQCLTLAGVEDLIEEQHRNARVLYGLVDHRQRTLLSLRVFRIFRQVVYAIMGTVILVDTRLLRWAVVLTVVLVIAALYLFLMSSLPARRGARNPEGIVLTGTRFADRLARLSYLADLLLTRVRSSRPAPEPIEAQVRAELISDLREIVDEVGELGSFEKKDHDMVHSVLDLGHTLVREAMVPCIDMATADADTPASSALRLFVRSGFFRISVVGDNVDDIRGILHFRDLVSRWEVTGGQLDMRVERMMRTAESAVEMKPADNMLRQMQAEHFHTVIVIDECGGVAGLAMLEDLLGGVVGELTDEHDRYSIEPEEVESGVWCVPARYPTSELDELLDREIEDEDVDSAGGPSAKATGRVSLPGATGTPAGVVVTVEEACGRRRQVSMILCRLDPDAQLLTSDLNPADDKDN